MPGTRPYYRIWIDGLLYYDATDSVKKARSVFIDKIFVDKKVKRFREKHPQWYIKVETKFA